MSKQAYIVKAYRTAVAKAPKGVFRFKRADELGAETIQHMMKELPNLDVKRIDDVIVGNATPRNPILGSNNIASSSKQHHYQDLQL